MQKSTTESFPFSRHPDTRASRNMWPKRHQNGWSKIILYYHKVANLKGQTTCMVSKFSNKITILVTEQPADFTILVVKKSLANNFVQTL